MTTQTIRVDRLRLRVHRQGRGRPLLLVNGLGASLEMWGPLRPHLPNREIISFDLPGAGRSSVPCVPLRMRGLANVIVTLLAELGVSRADVLGYSFGGLVAQELARRHPSAVDGLILAATAAGWPSWPPRPHVAWLMLTPARYHDRRLARAIVPVIAGGRTARETSVLMDSIDERVASPPSTLGYFQQLCAITGWTSQPWLGRLEQPTLVLHGTDDPIVPVVNARWMARRIPHASLAELPGAGHMLLIDEPERCGPEITRFLDGAEAQHAGTVRQGGKHLGRRPR
jgi:pimeloyl-ACP methyl ester carboxylesterase